MAPTLGESRLVILNGTDGSDSIVFLPGEKEKITVGSDPTCDVRYTHDEVRHIHFAIYRNEKGEIKIANNCTSHPIKVNGVEVPAKKALISGDVIALLDKNFRWELKEDAKRRKLSMPKSERKRQAALCMKTKKRITIHKINLGKKLRETEVSDAPIKDDQPTGEPSRRASTLETPSDEMKTECEPPTTPTKEQSELKTTFSSPVVSVSRNKENVTCSPKLKSLNLSGTLKTWFTPDKSASKKTSAKHALSESTSNASDGETTTPKAKKSMYLIDLTTPHPTKMGVSSPSISLSPKSTPTKKIVVVRQENTLLKSAIKNSTFKKKVEATPNRKVLTFGDNETHQESGTSSVIEVSMDSESPFNGSVVQSAPQTPEKVPNQTADFTGLQKMLKTPQKGPKNDLMDVSGVASLMKTPVATQKPAEEPSTDDEAKEVQELIDSISSVLDEHETANHSDESLENNVSFSKALEGNTSSPSQKENVSSMIFDDNAVSSTESKFDNIAGGSTIEGMSSIDSKFDSLIGRPSISKTYQPAKKSPPSEVVQDGDEEMSREKAETILNWVASARDSLAAESSNPVVQVNSSRYSNVTNESIASVKNLAYDATTPKIVNLQATDQFRKSFAASSQKLTMSPVTRLSLNENNVVVENYNVNNEIQKSLRSTRKRIGRAMSMMHNTSHQADTTIDPNETINLTSAETELDQSKQEPVNILSLDNQPQSSSNGRGADYAIENSNPPSNNYITFANSMDAQADLDKDIFEVSSNDNSVEELSQSDAYDSSSDSDASDEVEEKSREVGEKSKSLTKFRLSEQDMEDGVCPLNDSRTDEEVPSSQDADDTYNGEAEAPSADQSSLFCASTDQDAMMVEASQSQSTTADEPVNSSQEDIFDSDFDIPATQAFDEDQSKVEVQPPETIAEEESIMDSQETVSSSLVEGLGDVTQNDTSQVEEGEVEASETEEQPSAVEEQSSKIEEQSDEIEEKQMLAEDTPNLVGDVTTDLINDDTPDLAADDSNSENNQSSAQVDFDIPATQEVVEASITVAESSVDDSGFSMFASTDNQTVIADPNRVIPNETEFFTDSEFSRVEIPNELMETTVDTAASSDDELQGLADAPTFTKRAPSMAPLAGVKITLSRKTLAAQPEGEVSDDFVDDMKQQHKEAVFGKMEEQQNLEAMGQRKSLAPIPSVKTADLRKTMVPVNATLKPSFENFMKAKAQQLKEKEASDMDISLQNESSEVNKPQNSSVEASLRSADIDTESSIECVNLVTSVESIDNGSTTEASTSQETCVDSQEPSQSDETVDEQDFADQTAVVEEACVEKKAYVCTSDDDETAAEVKVAETPAPMAEETPAIPETPSRRRAARIDYSALATGTPKRRGRSVSVEVADATPAKPLKSAKKTAAIVEERDESAPDSTAMEIAEEDTETEPVELVPVVETPSRRHFAKIDYSELASGTPRRRGRSASVEMADPTPAKPPKSARKVEVIVEEPEHTPEPTQTDEATENVDNYDGQTPVVEEPCIEKNVYVCTPAKGAPNNRTEEIEAEIDQEVEEVSSEETTPAPVVQELEDAEKPSVVPKEPEAVQKQEVVSETPSRRRAAKIDYSALASGATPRRLADTPKTTGTPSRRGRSASIDSKASVESTSVATAQRVQSVKKLAPIIPEELEDQLEVVEASPKDVQPEKGAQVKVTRKRARKFEEKPEPPTEVRIEISAALVPAPTNQEVGVVQSTLEAENVHSIPEPEAMQPAPEPEAAASLGKPSGRQRRGARVNYIDLAAGPKIEEDTLEPQPSKSAQKAKAVEKKEEDTPAEIETAVPQDPPSKKARRGKQEKATAVAEPPATPISVPEKKKRTRKEAAPVKPESDLVVEAPQESDDDVVEVVEEPVEQKRGRTKKTASVSVAETSGTPKVAATSSRRVISKRKNVELEETPLKVAPEVHESPAPNKRKRRAASPTEPAQEEPVEPEVSARGAKRGLPKSQSTVEIVKTPTEVASKAKKGLAKSKSTIETPVVPAIKAVRATSRARTPKPIETPIPQRRGRKERVQSVDEPKEETPAAPVKTAARNKRKMEAEKPTETVEDSAPTTSRRGRKQEAEKAPEPVADSLPKTTSRRNAKKAEEPPVAVAELKSSRRGAAKKGEETPAEVEEPVVEAVPAKKSRREAAKKVAEPVEEEPVEQVLAKKAKGKAKKAEVVEAVEEEAEAPAKRGRGKKAVTVEPESPKVEPPAKRGAAKKQVTIATPSTAEVKPGRGTKRNLPAAVEEPVAKRATRARK